ncbi:MAG: hypothetical protein ACTHMM_26290 [Agriterribacter sp.]
MKRIITLFAVATIATTACKKDKVEDCVSATDKYVKAGQAYGANPSKENCEAYKAAIEGYKNSSCYSNLSQEQKNAFDQISGMVGNCE